MIDHSIEQHERYLQTGYCQFRCCLQAIRIFLYSSQADNHVLEKRNHDKIRTSIRTSTNFPQDLHYSTLVEEQSLNLQSPAKAL
jgi:hypothetical protein